MLTDRYLNGIPEGSRASRNDSLSPDSITQETLGKVQALNAIAAGAVSHSPRWRWRGRCATTGHFDAPGCEQRRTTRENLAALDNLEFSQEELEAIDRIAPDGSVNIWAASSAS